MQAEPLIHWPEPIIEYIGFLSQFIAVGAVGFRYAAVRHRLSATPTASTDAAEQRAFYVDACARAARFGLCGAIVQAILFATNLPAGAARAHTTVPALLTGDLATGLGALLTLLGIIGLSLAAARRTAGWPLATVGILLASLTGIVNGQWSRLVNPVHRLMAALWIGTLLILVVAGLVALLRDIPSKKHRGAIAADMVNGFSPLALVCGGIVVLSGLTTAWTHLNPLSSLWTTPYGWALLVKLTFVAVVFGLGAWNWRRVRPTLGTESAAATVRRSASGELAAAALVLAVTAVLVSLPSPRPPKPAKPAVVPATPVRPNGTSVTTP